MNHYRTCSTHNKLTAAKLQLLTGMFLPALFCWLLHGYTDVCAADKTGSVNSVNASLADPLHRLDNEFQKLYAEAREYRTNVCGPMIIVSRSRAILIDGHKRSEAKLISEEYDIFKTVDHATLGTYVALERFAGKSLASSSIRSLQTFQQYTQAAVAQLDNLSLPQKTLARQKELMHNTTDFIGRVLSANMVSANELNNFVRQQTPQLMENADEAAAIELSNLDKHMQAWKKVTPPARWNMLHVIVCDEHMPRQDERYMQYFLRFFDEKQEGKHVIYQEGNSDEKKAVQLLGTHLLDTSIAKAFFGDTDRMHRDLLSDGARKYLQQGPAAKKQ